MNKSVAEIAEQLCGTCDSLQNILERNDMDGADNNAGFCAELDSLVFCCEDCNWWHEQSEMAADVRGDWICEECKEERNA